MSKMFIPNGWTRGEPLKLIGRGPRYALMRNALPFLQSVEAMDSDIAAVEFNSIDEARAFAQWWAAPEDAFGLHPNDEIL